MNIQKRSTGTGAKESLEAWDAEGVFEEVWVGPALRGRCRHRLAIPRQLRKAIGRDCEGMHGVRPDRVTRQHRNNMPARRGFGGN